MSEKEDDSETPENSGDRSADTGEGSGNVCPTCGSEIPPEAPEGLCPKCALAGAAAPSDTATLPQSGPRFEPPSLETLAAAFPQLEILELVGCGGMGAVYKARQPHLDRFVALKILPPSLAASPQFTERFTREGRLLARLSHPNIVGVHDFGQAGGFFYLLMEFVDGANLRQAMRAGQFTPEQAMAVVPEICEALQFAHDEGILHRDVKPENILLDAKGRVKIADFGIAKLIGEMAAADPTLTGTAMPGTPHYMAPEQIEHPAEVDHRADIYSLGVVFYEMLTGELPIGRFAAPSEKSSVDSQIDEIVFRALEKERDRRQQSAGEVKTEIEGVPTRTIAVQRHPGYGAPAVPVPGRTSGGGKAAALVLLGFLLPLILNLGSLMAWRYNTESNRQRDAKAKEQVEMAKTEITRLAAEIGRLENLDTSGTTAEIQSQRVRELVDKRQELNRQQEILESGGRQTTIPASAMTWAPIGSFVLMIPIVLGCTIPGTIFGWASLRRIRALDLPESRAAPLFAALFWPWVLAALLMFALIALPMSYGPRWVAALGISLSIIASLAAGFWMIWAVLRWMKTTATPAEQAVARAELARPPCPWTRRIFLLLLMVLFLPVVLTVVYLAVASTASGVGQFLIALGVVCYFAFFIRAMIRSHGESSAGAEIASPLPANPWPRRIFWGLLVLFLVPVLLIFLWLFVPWLAYEPPPGKSHAIRIESFTENESSVSLALESQRFDGATNVGFHIRYEGPEIPVNESGDHGKLWPGQGIEWNLYGPETRRTSRATFVLPDRETANRAALALGEIAAGRKLHADLDELALFDVADGNGNRFKAWIDFESQGRSSDDAIEFEIGSIAVTGSSAKRLEAGFQRSGAPDLYLEVAQDVIPGIDGSVPESFRGPEETTLLRARGPKMMVWVLPDDFSEEAVREAARQIDENWVSRRTELSEGAVPEFANLKHPDGWRYVLFARVLREPKPPTDADAGEEPSGVE